MKDFAALFNAVDQTTQTTAKVQALAEFFRTAPDDDKLWTIALFSGRRPKRAVTTKQLRDWAAERADLPLWLLDESYDVVGDLAETLALILPPPVARTDKPLTHWIGVLQQLHAAPLPDRKTAILAAWDALDQTERFLFNKLITGGFRIEVSQKLMTRALAQATGQNEADLAHRLMGDWRADTTTFHALIEAEDPIAAQSRPYPFHLAHQLDQPAEELGDPAEWQAEWKWDGIRGQLIMRGGGAFCLVARRRADDRPVPRIGAHTGFSARWHGAGRGDPNLERDRPPSLCHPATAYRAQNGPQEAAGKRTGYSVGL